MPKIEIKCTQCGHEARVPEQFKGKKVRCLRCHAKLRVPDEAPLAPSGGRESAPQRSKERPRERRPREQPRAERGAREERGTGPGPSSRTRREALSLLRELLHEYDHAIESIPRGLEVDLRGVAFGVARQLSEELLGSRAIRDVKLAGGTGECRLVITLQGWDWNPEDSFAEDDDDTEVFQRGPLLAAAAQAGLLEPAIGLDDPATDPVWHLQRDLPGGVAPESTMQSLFVRDSSTKETVEPIALYEQARDKLEAGDAEGAVPLLEAAVRADKNFARAVLALGKAYASIGDYHRARRAFRHLVKLDEQDPEAQVLYAAAAVRCDRLDEAKLALAAAIRIDPDYKQAYRYAAQLWDRLGDPETARKFRARYQALKLRG
ncbi:MAG: tetratricopeptide repeat protein [Planctomycetota bacterium]